MELLQHGEGRRTTRVTTARNRKRNEMQEVKSSYYSTEKEDELREVKSSFKSTEQEEECSAEGEVELLQHGRG